MNISELKPQVFEEFYSTYLEAFNSGLTLMEGLDVGAQDFLSFLSNLSSDKLKYRYAPEKWTVAEALIHIIDTERIWQYRALRFSRGDKTPLPGFEQDDYVPESNANSRTIGSIKDEYIAVRTSTKLLFSSLNEKQLHYIGTAGDIPWSVAGLGFIISGHQAHHFKVFAEKYN